MLEDSLVKLVILNEQGSRLETLIDKNLSAGKHTAVWNSTGASGLYLYQLNVNGMVVTKKILKR